MRLIEWHRSALVCARSNAIRSCRLEKPRGGLGHLSGYLPQRRNVVQNPKRPSVRPDHQIVAVNYEIANRGGGQIHLQWLPMITIVKRNEHAFFSAGV